MPEPEREAANVLVIMSDQHSKYHIGCYGDPIVRTPHLDAMAEEGVRFTSAYCPSPVCGPSRMSFMTGRYPTSIRSWGNGFILSSAIPTWAHALGAAGYETALIGRMHFAGPDQRHGFEKRPVGEYYARFPGVDPIGGHPLKGIGRTGQHRSVVEGAGRGRTDFQAFDDTVTDGAIAYLKDKANEENGRPFALASRNRRFQGSCFAGGGERFILFARSGWAFYT